MTGSQARAFWKALMDNAAGLVVDARLLFDAGSLGRARSLMVLAQEELGKAIWVYRQFEKAWNVGDDSERTVERLKASGTSHLEKYQATVHLASDLRWFWGDYGDYAEISDQDVVRLAREANKAKQRGFYVDLDGSGDVEEVNEDADSIREDLQVASLVVEMLLIGDHTRMKHSSQMPYDSTHAQQMLLLPLAHPEEWANAYGHTASPVPPPRRETEEPPEVDPDLE